MKNITALTVLVIIINMFMVINSVYCQETAEKKYGFSIAPQLGFVYGQALEFVYNPPGAEREILSELIWEMKPVFYYGLYVDFGRIDLMSRPGFFASVSFKAGIPADSGVMEDRDWYQGVPPINENDDFTHFSSSTNKTREFFWLDVVVGASIPVKSLFYIKPFLSGSWTRFSFIAKDGYAMYPSGQESFEGEEVCNYQQDWFLSALGISVGTNILSPFSFDLSFQISPFTYCVAVDEHFKRKTKTEDDTLIFRDYTSMGLFLEPAGRFSFTVKRVVFSLEAAWRFTGKTRGNSYDNYNGPFYLAGEAGAGLSLFDLRFLVRFRI